MTTASGKGRNDDFSFPIWREPAMTASRFREITNAARAFAARHPSDPFAFGRIFLHLKRGIADPAEVVADARDVTIPA